MSKLDKYEKSQRSNAVWARAINKPKLDRKCRICSAVYKNNRWVAHNMNCPNCCHKYWSRDA